MMKHWGFGLLFYTGKYQSSSPCLDRCSRYSYTLSEDRLTMWDVGIGEDLVLYFGSGTVERWNTYRLKGPLDLLSEVGGAMGLITGWSVLSIVLYAGAAAGRTAKALARSGVVEAVAT